MTRREFFWSGFSFAALTGLQSSAFASRFISGDSSWCLSLLPWENERLKGLDFAKQFKAEYLLLPSSLLASNDFKPANWKTDVKRAGIRGTGFLFGPISYNFEEQSSELERFTQLAEKAKSAGGKFILVGSQPRESYGPGPDKLKKLASSLNAAGLIAKSKGLKLYFRNDVETFLRSSQEIQQVLNQTDKKNVQLAFDFAHFVQSGSDFVPFLQSNGRRIGLVVLKDLQSPFNRHDGKKSYSYRFVEPGLGKLDFGRLFEVLKEIKTEPIFLPEPQLPDPRSPKQLSLDYLERLKPLIGL